MSTFAGLPLNSMNEMPSDYGRVLIHGPQGAGKTTLASTIAMCGKTLFIDLTGERGVRSFAGASYEKNIVIVRPESIQALDDVFWELKKGEHDFKAVVIDSVTAVQKMTMRFLQGHDETAVREIKRGAAPADMRTWGQSLDVMTDLATFWFGLADGNSPHPMHVVFVAQTKINEDDFGNVTRVPDVQKGALSMMLASPDYVLYCDVEDNPDHMSDETAVPVHHIARFGAHPDYRTKARVPVNLRGKLPSVLGRKTPPNLTTLGQILGWGGVPPRKRAPAKTAPADAGQA